MISRRKLLAGAGATLIAQRVGVAQGGSNVAQGFSPAISVAGQPVEILITAISALTTRVSIVAAGGSATISGDGSLVDRGWPAPAARIATLEIERTIRVGNRSVVARVGGPERPALQLQIDDRRFSIDAHTGALTFALGDGPLFGLGEGGPQFDRRGSTIGPAQRPGRLPVAHARRPGAGAVADRRQRLGAVRPPAVRHIRSDQSGRHIQGVRRP